MEFETIVFEYQKVFYVCTLELISEFSDGNEKYKKEAAPLIGVCICSIVLGVSLEVLGAALAGPLLRSSVPHKATVVRSLPLEVNFNSL